VIDKQKTESEKHRSAARHRRASDEVAAIVGVYSSHTEVRCTSVALLN